MDRMHTALPATKFGIIQMANVCMLCVQLPTNICNLFYMYIYIYSLWLRWIGCGGTHKLNCPRKYNEKFMQNSDRRHKSRANRVLDTKSFNCCFGVHLAVLCDALWFSCCCTFFFLHMKFICMLDKCPSAESMLPSEMIEKGAKYSITSESIVRAFIYIPFHSSYDYAHK